MVNASDDAVRWTKVDIPTQGQGGNWVLADGSDVQHLTMAGDGTLYAYGQGLTHTLYKSTDNGVSWKHIGNVQDVIVDIAISPHDASNIYYATTANICSSDDGGKTFTLLSANPGGAGTGNVEITSLDVTWLNGTILAIGTRDTDNAEFGGIYMLDESITVPDWTNTAIGNFDVYNVTFSPAYTLDRHLIAVITDEVDTFTASKVGDFNWNDNIGQARLDRDNSGTPTPVVVAEPAAIAFPGNYDTDVFSGYSYYFVGIDTGNGNGDVYKIRSIEAPQSSTATDLNIGSTYGLNNIDVTGLSAYGEDAALTLLVGAADSPQTYLSNDGGLSWTRNRKQPTGQTDTEVLLAPDYPTKGVMYAATRGAGSAFSISRDGGVTWNQTGLVDATINTILDLAPSPVYAGDSTIFMITFDGEYSLWRTTDGGSSWERTISSNLGTVDSFNRVGLPPQYGTACQIVFLAGMSSGNPTVWESVDNGQNYRRRFTRDPSSSDPFTIDAWAIVNETTLFIGSYDGTRANIYQTSTSGFSYSEAVATGAQPLHSIVLSPGYEQDGTILVGNTNGWVYWSEDGGVSFQSLPGDAAAAPLSGSITVDYDPGYTSNHIVYAASTTADSGVFRLTTGTIGDWENIDGTLPSGTSLNQIGTSSNGTLYAANSLADSGMVRCLNPTFPLGPTLETVNRGLSDGATLAGLWQSGNRLWSVDTTNVKVMTYNDTLTTPVRQVSPENTSAADGNLIDHTISDIFLDWETLEGATQYQWQCDRDTDLSAVPAGFQNNTAASNAPLPALEPATTYYWRVRANAPVLSPWSEKWSFTTGLDTETINIRPESPAAGATDVPLKPVFQWTAVSEASAYELLVSADVDFTHPSIVKIGEYALPTTAWECDVSLEYDTTYYWKVRAISAGTHSDWGTTGAFTTLSPPETTPTPPDEPSPPEDAPPVESLSMQTSSLDYAPEPKLTSPPPINPQPPTAPQAGSSPYLSQSSGIPNWLIYLVGSLLLVIILALVIILTMVLKMRRI